MGNPTASFLFGAGIGLVSQFLQPYFPAQTWITPLGLTVGVMLIAWAMVIMTRQSSWWGRIFHFAPATSGAAPIGSVTKGEKVAKNSFTIGDNNEVSNVHVGDVTINQAPAPQLELSNSTKSQNADGSWTTKITADIISPYPAKGLRVEAWGEGVLSVDLKANSAGVHMFARGVRADHAFATAQNVSGQYFIVAVTRENTPIEIRYAFNA